MNVQASAAIGANPRKKFHRKAEPDVEYEKVVSDEYGQCTGVTWRKSFVWQLLWFSEKDRKERSKTFDPRNHEVIIIFHFFIQISFLFKFNR